MSIDTEFAALLSWCQAAPRNAGWAAVGDDWWGFHAANARLGTAWFCWFPTREEMLRYFGDCWGCDCREDAAALADDLALALRMNRGGEYVRRYEAGEMDEDRFLAHLSEAYADVTVYWLGTLTDLMEGDSSFAREWRADFRGVDVAGDGYPIQDDEFDDAYRALAWD